MDRVESSSLSLDFNFAPDRDVELFRDARHPRPPIRKLDFQARGILKRKPDFHAALRSRSFELGPLIVDDGFFMLELWKLFMLIGRGFQQGQYVYSYESGQFCQRNLCTEKEIVL